MNKLILNIDSTSLGTSSCILHFIRTIVGDINEPDKGAYRTPVNNVNLNYGIAVHKFLDTMYKTRGHYPTAKDEAIGWFLTNPHIPDKKKGWMSDPKHILTTCYMVWTEFVEKDGTFELLKLPGKCWWCDGEGTVQIDTGVTGDGGIKETLPGPCDKCRGSGLDLDQSATEVTFTIPYYEDDFIIVNLCGTIDKVGKFIGGVYNIDDWKTTGHRSDDKYARADYFSQYEMSRQLRFYTLACKLMARKHPESIMGQVGATRMGASITAIFLKPNANETVVDRSDVYSYSDQQIAEFESSLMAFITKLSAAIAINNISKEGIINGTCEGKWRRCAFWDACRNPDNIAQVLLNRGFKRVVYNPLAFND